VLLGATEHGVAPIHRYTEEEAREAGIFSDEEPPEERSRLGAVGRTLLAGGRRAVEPADQYAHSPVAGPRPDPMRATPPAGGLVERLREMTVRR
jgi:hypothetical protein